MSLSKSNPSENFFTIFFFIYFEFCFMPSNIHQKRQLHPKVSHIAHDVHFCTILVCMQKQNKHTMQKKMVKSHNTFDRFFLL